MDAGIIRNLKLYYKKLLVEHILKSIENNNNIELPNEKDAIHMISSAWNLVKQETIANS